MTLNPMCKEFRGLGAYGIMDKWILQTFALCNRNKEETWNKLESDKENRWKIKKLHEQRSKENGNRYQILSDQIDQLVRARNVRLEDLKKLNLRNHYFDFHWMTTNGAKKYLEDIKKAIEEIGNGTSVNVITGQGKHSSEKTSFLQLELLREFCHCLKKHPTEEGVLVLTVRGRPTYAQAIRLNR